jgi:hypothetical protein
MKRRIVEPGRFEPAPPPDAEGVLRLLAVGARTACAAPERLGAVDAAIARVTTGLSAPAALAAADAGPCWRRFVARASSLPPGRWAEAGVALVTELEALGQKLEVMPLPGWDRLPEGLDDGR